MFRYKAGTIFIVSSLIMFSPHQHQITLAIRFADSASEAM